MDEDTGCVVVILQFAKTYHMTLVDGMCRVLEPLGLRTVIHLWADHATPPPPSLLRLLRHGNPRGALVVGFGEQASTRALNDLASGLPDLPKVFIGDTPRQDGVGSVRCDNAAGMQLVAQHLVEECGSPRTLVVRGWPQHEDSQEREEALLRELARRGVPVAPEQVVDGNFQRETAFQAVHSALATAPGIDAVVAFNDQSALGALEAVQESGRRVPEDVVVIGFDNEHAGTVSTPSLSTVDQDLAEQSELAARLLLQMMDGGPALSLRSPVRLIARESTARTCPRPTTPDPHPAALHPKVEDLEKALSLSRAFMLCSTLPEATRQLRMSVERLNLRTAYLVLCAPLLLAAQRSATGLAGPAEEPDPADQPRGLVVMGWEQGSVVDISDERPFDLGRILPSHLDRITESIMIYPLWGGDVELGYVVSNRPSSTSSAVNEVLQVDVHRCLETIHARMRLSAHADELERQVAERTIELERANQQLGVMARRDALTGLPNRATFQQALHELWTAGAASGEQLSLLMLDVDHFKAYNDRYGHLQGDAALRSVARCLGAAVRASAALAARYGGEEFVLLLPDTAPAGALALAQRIRQLLAQAAIPHEASASSSVLTVSVGISTMVPEPRTDPDALLAGADLALYEAKRQGRDHICTAPETHPRTAAAF